MGMLAFKAHPLTVFSGAAGAESHSEVFDIADAVEVHMQLKITAIDQTLTVKYQKSVDGLHWDSGTQIASTNSVGVTLASMTSDIYRFLRFEYVFPSAAGKATFEIDVYAKNYS